MAKKRATLPNDFGAVMERNNLDELRAVFEKCDINAYERDYLKTPALCQYAVSVEFIEWLLQHGADIEAADSYGRTALYRHAQVRQPEKVRILLQHGADVHKRDIYGDTPLHQAYLAETVGLLLAHGADARAKNERGQTPLLAMLQNCQNNRIAETAQSAEIYLQHSVKINAAMRERVAEIGEEFEWHRSSFNPEYLPETERGLQKLYALFQVTPATRHQEFDGVTEIKVGSDTWQQQFEELWNLLVPGSGAANTVQGEIIRICGKVARELLNNGACNWSREYKKLPKALPDYFARGNPIGEQAEATALAKSIGADTDEDDLRRLSELAVKWVLHNPQPITLDKPPYSL